MKKITLKNKKKEGGFVILFAVTISAILLAIALGVANIALKEVKFTTSAKDTNNAFFAADTGIEYVLLHDKAGDYELTPPETFHEWNIIFSPDGAGKPCSKIKITKDSTTPAEKVIIIATGYSLGDASCVPISANHIERQLQVTYYGGSTLPPAVSTNLFVAVGAYGGSYTIANSTDGTDWTGVTNSSSILGRGYGVAWSGSTFVAVGGYNGSPSIVHSTDGINWTAANNSTNIFTTGYGVTWNGSMFVAVGAGNNSIAHSTDGVDWVGVPSSNNIFNPGNGVAWNGSTFVAVGNGNKSIATSTDGITWTGILNINSIFCSGQGIAWSSSLNLFVAVGGGCGANAIATSPDGATWTGRGTPVFTGGYGLGIAWSNSLNLFVALGAGSNNMATSPDGINWTGRGNSVFPNGGYGVAWNGSTFVAVGYANTYSIAHSTDGINWTGVPNSNSIMLVGTGVASAPAPDLVPPRLGIPP